MNKMWMTSEVVKTNINCVFFYPQNGCVSIIPTQNRDSEQKMQKTNIIRKCYDVMCSLIITSYSLVGDSNHKTVQVAEFR